MRLTVSIATVADAARVAAVRNAAASDLTLRFGRGHWTSETSARSVLGAMETSRTLVGRRGRTIVGTLRLATKKPWAIDVSYFTPVRRPVYLLDMAVDPSRQRQGVGSSMLEAAREHVLAWPADAIRLDAYDDAAGAGPFYAKCGYRETGRVVYRNNPLIYYELVLGTPTGRKKR